MSGQALLLIKELIVDEKKHMHDRIPSFETAAD
jgi:hypothetical protein